MSIDVRPLGLILFAFTFWLGGYLLARNSGRLAMQLAGWGLIAYALALDVLAGEGAPGVIAAARTALAVLPAAPWALALAITLRRGGAEGETTVRRPVGLLAIGVVFFAMSMALLVLDAIPAFWALMLIGFDLGLLGVGLARLDAFDQGESMGRDALRSLAGAGVMAAVFGGAVLVAAAANGGLTPPLLALAFVVIGLVIDLRRDGACARSGRRMAAVDLRNRSADRAAHRSDRHHGR